MKELEREAACTLTVLSRNWKGTQLWWATWSQSVACGRA